MGFSRTAQRLFGNLWSQFCHLAFVSRLFPNSLMRISTVFVPFRSRITLSHWHSQLSQKLGEDRSLQRFLVFKWWIWIDFLRYLLTIPVWRKRERDRGEREAVDRRRDNREDSFWNPWLDHQDHHRISLSFFLSFFLFLSFYFPCFLF